MAIKPCAKCHHAKSRHRRHECREVWQSIGATFMGVRVIAKWCPCDGYLDPTGPEKNATQTHTDRRADR